MEDRPLAFDHIPVIVWRVGTQDLGGAGSEVRHYGVDRDARARNQDPGLTGGAEIRADAARPECAHEGESGVLLSERAVGAYGEESFAAPPRSGSDWDAGRRLTHVDEAAAQTLGGLLESRVMSQPAVHAAHEIESCPECIKQ